MLILQLGRNLVAAARPVPAATIPKRALGHVSPNEASFLVNFVRQMAADHSLASVSG